VPPLPLKPISIAALRAFWREYERSCENLAKEGSTIFHVRREQLSPARQVIRNLPFEGAFVEASNVQPFGGFEVRGQDVPPGLPFLQRIDQHHQVAAADNRRRQARKFVVELAQLCAAVGEFTVQDASVHRFEHALHDCASHLWAKNVAAAAIPHPGGESAGADPSDRACGSDSTGCHRGRVDDGGFP
jgi:hypothetical protein